MESRFSNIPAPNVPSATPNRQRFLSSFANLLDARFDRDSCGVGFVAQLSGEPSHSILQKALPALARAPRPVYSFLRQRFAQVTNPPIDPLRETVVIQMHTRLGTWPHILELRQPLPGLSLKSPLLTLAEMNALKHMEHPMAAEFPIEAPKCFFEAETSLEAARSQDNQFLWTGAVDPVGQAGQKSDSAYAQNLSATTLSKLE